LLIIDGKYVARRARV